MVHAPERIIAWGRDFGGEPVVVTTVALYVPTAAAHQRLPFELIANAGWAEETLVVTMVGPRSRRYRARLSEPGQVPVAVRERVTASIALSEHVTLAAGAGARITARRVPGADELTWNVVFDPGLDPSDPVLRGLAEAAIGELRASTGL